MKCPHCLENFFEIPSKSSITEDLEYDWTIKSCICPPCKRAIISLGKRKRSFMNVEYSLIYPKTISRSPIPQEVPEDFAIDYKEACLVIADSNKASAALSRRALQHILKEKGGALKKDLSDQIQEILDGNKLPTYISSSLDAVRHIGNFAAHTMKSKSTGEIVDVEIGEAEWNLDVIEQLFNFYFVQPKLIESKREKLNQKLKDAGKPELQ